MNTLIPARLLLSSVVLGATLITAAAAALAQPTEQVRVTDGIVSRMKVYYGDLDLKVPTGQIELKRRLARAATQVCVTADDDSYCIALAQQGSAAQLAAVLDNRNHPQLALATHR